jgi:2-polyprenyl-3-methyl-5-hydroxy-6-metoxy-1,4-benzoquinol methylase
MKNTKEQQYSDLFDIPATELGFMINQVWRDDPKRVSFVLARYKFVAKMLADKANVLEIGCADAFASRMVAQEVKQLTVSDFDPVFIQYLHANGQESWQKSAFVFDVSKQVTETKYDAIYCLDVFEHILPELEHDVLSNMSNSVGEKGVVIIGIPSLESQPYASEYSKAGHVNCKSGNDFKKLLNNHFSNVFLFSMNDEVVHTGYYPMAHYLIALCVK